MNKSPDCGGTGTFDPQPETSTQELDDLFDLTDSLQEPDKLTNSETFLRLLQTGYKTIRKPLLGFLHYYPLVKLRIYLNLFEILVFSLILGSNLLLVYNECSGACLGRPKTYYKLSVFYRLVETNQSHLNPLIVLEKQLAFSPNGIRFYFFCQLPRTECFLGY